jgi:periplasmic protein TonB
MPTTDAQVGSNRRHAVAETLPPKASDYLFTIPESPGLLASLREGLREWRRSSKITVSSEYYRGEVALPITEMRPWYRDFGSQIKTFFEKPKDPIGIFNRAQRRKRDLCGVAAALAGGGTAWALGYMDPAKIILGVAGGYILGEAIGVFSFKMREYPPDIWQEYKPQSASWVNSLLVHAIVILALILPYYISRMLHPVGASKVQIVDLTLPELPPGANKAGGGGGGGERAPTPASKGKAPEFSRVQLAPPRVEMPKLKPLLPVQPTLLGPPELKLPQMAANAQWGDPLQGVPGPPSGGPGYGGGIGSGQGTGIGSGSGGGLGPGEGGGAGGGVYSVGGGVSPPVPIYKPEPPYSEEARKAKYQGTCVLWIVVDAQGSVTQAQVVKPLGMGLDENALTTVKTWKFRPALRNGTPVPVRVSVEVTFHLF